jgi:ABC-type uncharacterized transport system permease subunit
VLHAFTVYVLVATPNGIDLGLYPICTLITFIMALTVVVASIVRPVQSLLIMLFPLAAISLVAAAVLDSAFVPLSTAGPGLIAHILVSIIAYSILMMAACQSLIVGHMEHRIRTKQNILLLRILPPLESMEGLLFAMLWLGFGALTLAITSGFLFLDDMFAQHVVHHTVLACVSWLAYLVLLVGHHAFGWRGGSAVRWTLVAFALLLLAYIGSKFVIEIVLGGRE